MAAPRYAYDNACARARERLAGMGPRAHQNFKQVFEPIQLLPGAGAFTDIANAVYFLVSHEARFITGQVLDINGRAAGKL